ncbi:hypothetical protein [Coxiella burnetii]|uniref:Hypothetical membrane associated protein n=1 Tax=Coxiella burnetii (strain RSA 493 / Nine Mile phase I) TaxID=227377 RepID=Q83CH6_COXBU|nr:hypothetical protein [Coxiella burnetii]NP_820138.2 membrane-associated protein [Coxiella burnetii RSA 493]AAO90652.2 hypothetical membrane associated protein [Coxiella burnetii RSA 493]ARI66866.1 hypothetical protein B7L74_05865 [Coxiella burnetii]AZV76409.1 hypothetical protein D6219_09830 [Coxiella burnetii]MCF2093632.1 hypothetical protein [Coxiella burnetii]MCF2095720.1 hypothetical protein [Coxiella burnetii]
MRKLPMPPPKGTTETESFKRLAKAYFKSPVIQTSLIFLSLQLLGC